MATLHLICGLPGSGKSTLARELERDLKAVLLTPDAWMLDLGFDGYDEAARARVEALQWELARQLLARGLDVILENGFWARSERDDYRKGAAAVGAHTRLHYLDAPLEELRRRVISRNAALPAGAFVVNPEDLAGWAEMFEAPGLDELRDEQQAADGG